MNAENRKIHALRAAAVAACVVYCAYWLLIQALELSRDIGVSDDQKASGFLMLGLLAADGLPIYLPLDSADRISHLYGPLAFWPLSATAGLENPALGARWFGFLRAVAALALAAFAFQRLSGSFLFAAIACILLTVVYGEDGWSYMENGAVFFGLALFAASPRRGAFAPTAMAGVGLFVAINAKITALAYFPPLALALRMRPATFALSLVFALILSAVLFASHPSFSFPRYYDLLTAIGSGRKIESFRILKNIIALLVALAPLAAVAWLCPNARRGAATMAAAACFCALPVVFYIAALEGANPNHVRHFAIPAWAGAAALFGYYFTPSESMSRKLKALLALAIIGVAAQEENFIRRHYAPHAARWGEDSGLGEFADLRARLAGRKTYSAGYCNWAWVCPPTGRGEQTRNDKSWIFRAVLYGDGYRHFIDPPAASAMDSALRFQNPQVRTPPEATFDVLRERQVDTFALAIPPNFQPKEEARGEWAEVFRANYQLCETGAHYQLWCAKTSQR